MSNDNKNTIDFETIINDLNIETFEHRNGIPYARFVQGNRIEVHPLKSLPVTKYIMGLLYSKSKRALSSTHREMLLQILAAKATGRKEDVWVRSAPLPCGGIQYDLADEDGNAVFVTEKGWEVRKATANFFRPTTSRSLPIPATGGDYSLFKQHFRTRSEGDLKLIVGYMLASMRPNGPHAVLVFRGEQGSAKSTSLEMVKRLVDPTSGAARAMSRTEQDLFVSAQYAHIVSYDNVSSISAGMSDALCRLTTKGAMATRALYSDGDEFLIEACKPVLMNGITDIIVKSDLMSRAFIIDLPAISKSERKTEEAVWADFNKDAPQLFGLLLDGLVSALQFKEAVKVDNMPRMADIVTFCTAAEQGMKWEQGAFSRAVESNQKDSILTSLSNDPVAVALRQMMIKLPKGAWKGNATDLLLELEAYRPEWADGPTWPRTATALSGILTRLAHNLRVIGIHMADRERTARERLLVIEKQAHFMEMNGLPTGEPPLKVVTPSRFNDGRDNNDADLQQTIH